MQTLMQIVDSIFLYFVAINVMLYLYSAFKNKKIKSLNLLTTYLTLIALNQIVAMYFANLNKNNLFLFHIYLVIQFVSLSFFYKSLFGQIQKKIVNILILVVSTAFLGYYLVWPEDFAYFNLPEILLTIIPVLAYIMMHLYNSLSSKGNYLYISGGLLVYLPIHALIFILYALSVNDLNSSLLSEDTLYSLTKINVFFYFLLQIVIFLEWKLNISKWTAKKVL